MTRSHPPTLLRLVSRCLETECSLPRGAALAVAVSGGPDSMALLHALSCLRERHDFRLLAISVDHGLRPEAAREVELVERCAAAWGVEFSGISLGLSPSSNQQERARLARYEALWRAAHERLGPDAFLVTAHHKQDRAETVLLRLLRGSSLAGLGVLAPRDNALLRPAIRASREALLLHAQRHDVPYVHDPSNLDPDYLRVRVRHELLPLLLELAPGALEHLLELSDEALQGDPALGLNREQRRQLRRALSLEASPVDLRLPRGLRLVRE